MKILYFSSILALLIVTGDFTLLAWVKVIQLKSNAQIMDFGNTGPNNNLQFSLSKDLTGKPYVYHRDNSASWECVSPTALILNRWYHLAAVLQGYSFSLYIDGVLVCNDPSVQNRPTAVIRQRCMIGRSNWASEVDANADYDELKIYSRALSQTEILYDKAYSHN